MSNDDDLLRLTANPEESTPEVYPELYNLSAAFFFKFIPRPKKPSRPEFLYVPPNNKKHLEVTGLFAEWNLAWESAQLRNVTMFRKHQRVAKRRIPGISGIENKNVYLLLDTPKRLEAYTPLFAMLPIEVLNRFGLPPLRRMLWPSSGAFYRNEAESELPPDFRSRLSKAFAYHVWSHFESGSRLHAFSKDDPLQMLAHNLDFWLPHATRVIENRLSRMDLVEFENKKDMSQLKRIQSSIDPTEEFSIDRCRMGGPIWMGSEDALEASREMIKVADTNDKLCSLINAIRSNRVEEDFSARWSYAREDFERKLYNKRSRIRVKFVELDHAASVVGAESEIHDSEVWHDFFAILNEKEKEIVVCLAGGQTNLSEAAIALGYANHSPISKALQRIRKKVKERMGI